MPVRALLFDFDGLIVDTESPSLAAWRWAYAQNGQELSLDRWSAARWASASKPPTVPIESLVGPRSSAT